MKYIVLFKARMKNETQAYWYGHIAEEKPSLEEKAAKIRDVYGERLEMLLDIKIKEVPDYLDVSICDECRLLDNQDGHGIYTPIYSHTESNKQNTLIWQIIALVSLSGLLISQILRLLSELL